MVMILGFLFKDILGRYKPINPTQPDRHLFGLGWVGFQSLRGLGWVEFMPNRPCWVGFGLGEKPTQPNPRPPLLARFLVI